MNKNTQKDDYVFHKQIVAYDNKIRNCQHNRITNNFRIEIKIDLLAKIAEIIKDIAGLFK